MQRLRDAFPADTEEGLLAKLERARKRREEGRRFAAGGGSPRQGVLDTHRRFIAQHGQCADQQSSSASADVGSAAPTAAAAAGLPHRRGEASGKRNDARKSKGTGRDAVPSRTTAAAFLARGLADRSPSSAEGDEDDEASEDSESSDESSGSESSDDEPSSESSGRSSSSSESRDNSESTETESSDGSSVDGK